MDIPKIKKLSVQKLLNNAIREALSGGSTDPGYSELESAASMYVALKNLNLKIYNEKDLVEELRGRNIFDRDFLEEFIL